MPSLERVQSAMMRALDLGPAHLPEELFAAGRQRALLGMKVHANTISHARLIALEDTFPRTRALLGHEAFNQISRAYLELPGVAVFPLACIGKDFSAFLGTRADAREAAGLAAFEWLWLEAYHAAEAPALVLADLAGTGDERLLEIVLARHPAVRLAGLDNSVWRAIGEEVPGLCDAPAALLTRPGAQVLVSPATPAMAELLARCTRPITACNLLETCSEPVAPDQSPAVGITDALLALIGAGALQRVG